MSDEDIIGVHTGLKTKVFNKAANKHMFEWSIASFKNSHPRLLRSIFEAMEDYRELTKDVLRKPKVSSEQESLKELVLAEYDKGNIVAMSHEGLKVGSLKDIVNQPVEGILYDLNRNEIVILTFLDDPKWVNDLALVKVVKYLYAENQELKLQINGE